MNSRRIKIQIASVVMATVSMFGLASCDESEGKLDVDYSAPAKVTGVTSTSAPGEISLSWTIPNSRSFGYSKLVYTDPKGEEVYKIFAKDQADDEGRISTVIGGFLSSDEVTFKIYACAVRGENAGAVEYVCAPGDPEFVAVLKTLTAEADWGGVRIGYKNETGITVPVKVDFHAKADPSKCGSVQFETQPNTSGSETVHLWIDELEFICGEEVELSLAALDSEGNPSKTTEFTVRPKLVKALDRSLWTVPGWEDSYDPQIGYSSQECGGEGKYPKGRVQAMFDGDIKTYWTTRWKGFASDYPHFFIVDLGKDHDDIVGFTMRRGSGKSGTHKGETMWTCPEASASNPADPATWTWTDQGHFAFDASTNQTQFGDFKEPTKARYVKATFAESDKGTTQYIFISEFNVYVRGE